MRKGPALHISPLVAVLFAVLVVSDRSGVCLLSLLAALLHEGGHLAAARLLRIPLGEVRLELLGARIEVTGRMLSYGEEWLLCAAGPMTSLLCAALAAPLWNLTAYAQIFSCASLVLGALNLLPIRTFDGGRMTECALLTVMQARTVEYTMRLISFFFLFLLWAAAVYFLLRVEDGLSLLCFSMSLLMRFFDAEWS